MATRLLATAGSALAALSVASGTIFAQQVGGKHSEHRARSTATQHKPDRAFAKKAAEGSAAEVALGKLAERKGNASVVKDFGKQLVRDHGKVGEELQAAASTDNIETPDKMSPKDQRIYDRLEKLSRRAFDHAYARTMLTNHQRDVAMFRQEATHGSEPAIKQFAANTLPVLKHHLQLARMMNDEVRSGTTQGQRPAPKRTSQLNGSQKPTSRTEH